MAAQGGVVFQEKVSRLLSRQDGRPVLKPSRGLALKDAVANRKLKKGGRMQWCSLCYAGMRSIQTYLHQCCPVTPSKQETLGQFSNPTLD